MCLISKFAGNVNDLREIMVFALVILYLDAATMGPLVSVCVGDNVPRRSPKEGASLFVQNIDNAFMGEPNISVRF